MTKISVPDDAPPVLAPSAAFPGLQARAELDYHDTLPGSESTLIERIGQAEVVLNIRSSSKLGERVFATCPNLRLVSLWGTGTDHVDLAAAGTIGEHAAGERRDQHAGGVDQHEDQQPVLGGLTGK